MRLAPAPRRVGRPDHPAPGRRGLTFPLAPPSAIRFMPTFEGDFSPPPGRFAIVAARFNSMISEALLGGCRDAFARHGVADDRLDLAWVPGSFEIPLVARKLAGSGK